MDLFARRTDDIVVAELHCKPSDLTNKVASSNYWIIISPITLNAQCMVG